MSRLSDHDMLPDDWARERDFYPEIDENAPMKQPKWKLADVWAYRQALVNLGIDANEIENIIERDCGPEFCERPYLSRRQAG
jgi:hypothetical protein